MLEACWPERWCWLEGADLVALDGASEESVYVVDASGRVFLRSETDTWLELPGVLERRAERLYVAARNDVYVLAQHRDEAGTFLDHFDGERWTTLLSNVDPGFLLGFGRESVWVREAGTLRWMRRDADGDTHTIADFDEARFGPITTGVIDDRIEPIFLPAPGGDAYVMATNVVTVVYRYQAEWDRWAPLAAMPTSWGTLAWSEGELRAIDYGTTGVGADCRELRFDGTRWVVVREAPERRYLLGDPRGVVVSNDERSCYAMSLPLGDTLLCADDRTVVTLAASSTTATTSSSPREATRPFDDALWDAVAPGYFVGGARRAWGRGPRDYVRTDAHGLVERALGGAPAPLVVDHELLTALDVDGLDEEPTWLLDRYGWYRLGSEGAIESHRSERGPLVAIEAVPGGAWALRSDWSGVELLRIEGSSLSVDHAFTPIDDATTGIRLEDVTVDEEGDVWLVGVVGLRAGRSTLFHRTEDRAGARVWHAIELPTGTYWPGQIVAHGGDLYLGPVGAGHSGVLRIARERVLDGTLDEGDFVTLTSTPDIGDRPDAQLWVGDSGVWLTDEDVALFYPHAP